jgi:hypothetical protein
MSLVEGVPPKMFLQESQGDGEERERERGSEREIQREGDLLNVPVSTERGREGGREGERHSSEVGDDMETVAKCVNNG